MSPQLRIGLRVFYNRGWMGGVHYVLNIARMLQRLPPDERPHVTLLTSSPEAEAIASEHTELADEIAEFRCARELDLDFVYPATQIAEAPFGAPWAGWVPDWQCRHHPELFARDERMRRFLQYRAMANEPAVCVFSSQQALDDTRKLFPDSQALWRIFRFPAVFDDEAYALSEAHIQTVKEKFGAPARYLIVCNQFWRHKNHRVILEALRRRPDLDIHVVMTGALEDERWPDYVASVRSALDAPEVRSKITLTGPIPRSDQIALMRGSCGIVQPSMFEGWSTLVEEARALGLPALLSDIPVHREQSPPGAQFFDPTDSAALAELLVSFEKSPPEPIAQAQARDRQNAHILAAARTFMEIVRETRACYDPARHDTVEMLARIIPGVRDEIGGDAGVLREDYDRLLAGVRLALRHNPDDLGRLASILCDESNPFADTALREVVVATLAKCDAQTRRRFLEFELLSDTVSANAAAAARTVTHKLSSPVARSRIALSNALFRARDYARRKLGDQFDV